MDLIKLNHIGETTMSNQEKINAILEVQEQLIELVGELKNLAEGDDWAEVYIIAHLECTISSNHEWLDSSQTIDDWIKNLRDEDDEW